jgi:hypothetical protein
MIPTECICPEESFLQLLVNAPHWGFEIVTTLIVDGLVLGFGWRFIQKHWGEHKKAHHGDHK